MKTLRNFLLVLPLLLVMEATVAELIQLLSEPVSAEELWRAKEYLRGEILIGAEASNTRMSQLATQELYFGRFLPLEELVEGVRSISAEQIQALAAEMFQPGRLAISTVGAVQGIANLESNLGEIIGL